MRPVTPAMFMRLPARMKNGTASSGKLSTPAIMRWATITSGTMPVARMYRSDDTAMASATGSPISIRARKEPRRISMALVDRHRIEGFGALEDRIPAAPVLDRDLDRAHEHQEEADEDAGVEQ